MALTDPAHSPRELFEIPKGVSYFNSAYNSPMLRASRDRLVEAAEKDSRIVASLAATEAKKLIYRLGTEVFRGQLLLQWAGTGAPADDLGWRVLLALAGSWKPPALPLDGNDVMALGIEEGPRIGVLLREVEHWWEERDFAPDRAALLSRLKEAAIKPRA